MTVVTHKDAMQRHASRQARERHGVTLGPGLHARILREIRTGRGIASGMANIYWITLQATPKRSMKRFLIVYDAEHDEIATVLPDGYHQLKRKLNRVTMGELHAIWS